MSAPRSTFERLRPREAGRHRNAPGAASRKVFRVGGARVNAGAIVAVRRYGFKVPTGYNSNNPTPLTDCQERTAVGPVQTVPR